MKRPLLLTTLAAFIIGGCASTDGGEALVRDREPITHPLERSDGARVVAPAATQETFAVPDGAGPDDYVRLALERNPRISAARWRVESMRQQVPQMTSLEDPMFEAAFIGEMEQDAMLGVSQTFPFPGKLRTAGDVERREVEMALQDLRMAQIEVAADVRKAYWTYAFTNAALAINQQALDLLRQFRDSADTRFRAGLANLQDVLRASVELNMGETELIALRQRYDTTRGMLNALLDRPIDAPLPEPQAVSPDQVTNELTALLARATEASPELGEIRQRIEAERSRYRAARLNRWPDLTVGLTYEFMGNDDAGMEEDDEWWVTFGVNVPLWQGKRRAAERQALANRYQAVADLRSAENQVSFRVLEALNEVQTQQRQVTLLADVVLPQSRQSLDASASAYSAGRADFEALIESWRQLLEAQLMHAEGLADLGRAIAELEQAVGGEIDRGAATPPATQTNNRSPQS